MTHPSTNRGRAREKCRCEHCGTLFYPWKSRPGRFCSYRCSMAIAAQRRGTMLWQERENALLEKLSGVEPFPVIVEKLNAYEKRKSWPVRSAQAIQCQMKRLGLSQHCTLDNLNGRELADALGVSCHRVRNWIVRSGCPYYRKGTQLACIPLKEFRDWAARYPRLLADIDPERLYWILQDADLVELIRAAPPILRGKACPVLRTDTMAIYPTIRAAAQSIFVAPAALRQAIEEKRPCVGVEFVRLR